MWYLYLSETPVSQRETACLEMPSSCANASWDIPAFFRQDRILSPIILCASFQHRLFYRKTRKNATM